MEQLFKWDYKALIGIGLNIFILFFSVYKIQIGIDCIKSSFFIATNNFDGVTELQCTAKKAKNPCNIANLLCLADYSEIRVGISGTDDEVSRRSDGVQRNLSQMDIDNDGSKWLSLASLSACVHFKAALTLRRNANTNARTRVRI